MIRIRPFQIEDLNMDLQPIYPKSAKHNFMDNLNPKLTFTLYDDVSKAPLVCAAFIAYRDAGAGVNMLISQAFLKHKKETIFVLREGLGHYMEKFGFIRVHATIRADFPTARKWIKILGFQEEGIMKKYGAENEDHILFAKVV